jgi:glycosyltransferase involved in cell wall biosynthesis
MVQTYSDFEVLVCDDASTDGTWAYLETLNWDKLRLFRNEINLNLPATMTKLVASARGAYLAFQHDHEPSEPRWLETMLRFMEDRPDVGFAGCLHWTTDPRTGEKVELPENPRVFPPDGTLKGQDFITLLATMIHTPFNPSGAFFRVSAALKVGGYNNEWFLASDEDFYRRIAQWGDVGLCRERLQQFRSRPQERSSSLGGWRGIYNNFAFRKDTSRRFWKVTWRKKAYNQLRLAAVEMLTAWELAMSLFIRGRGDVLLMAVAKRTRCPMPFGARPMGRIRWVLFTGGVYVLAWLSPLGKALGRLRGH